ncbi:hypothetical protein CYMTET_45144 [Cymbomonas tetramitiformis]|uniref:Core domain-containing protein n=1 Tax=Cymbomonas tetramitiformis TaxID=36881 RepID=A0AAE0C010_9CHLO|nr:hypothetical protein CYMTET_45144 [Cymbomonas tetramitiformis]
MSFTVQKCAVRTTRFSVPHKIQGHGVLTTTTRSKRAVLSFAPRKKLVVSSDAAVKGTGMPPAITLTENAVVQLKKLREDKNSPDLCLRVGVRQGGCSGMSYVMEFEELTNVSKSDSVIDNGEDGFPIVCDPKSLLFLFGLQLDYSDELIGGGFAFNNPNADSTCGCGKSFSA